MSYNERRIGKHGVQSNKNNFKIRQKSDIIKSIWKKAASHERRLTVNGIVQSRFFLLNAWLFPESQAQEDGHFRALDVPIPGGPFLTWPLNHPRKSIP